LYTSPNIIRLIKLTKEDEMGGAYKILGRIPEGKTPLRRLGRDGR